MKYYNKKTSFLVIAFFFIIFSFSYLSATGPVPDEANKKEIPNKVKILQIPTVTSVQNYDVVLPGHLNADEGITRGRSRFPKHPERFLPMPLPDLSTEGATQIENKWISYNSITGEEIINESSFTDDEVPISGCVIGGAGGGIIGQEKIKMLLENIRKKGIRNFNDLSLITNPEDNPWRVNVKLFMTFPDGYYVGSGVLIDPKHVLTAGHCVYDVDSGEWAKPIVVVPAYKDGWRPYGDASAVKLHSWTGWTQNGNFNDDIGVIELDRPIGALTSWNGYGYNDDPYFYTGTTFHNPGYPAAYPYTGENMCYWYGNYNYTEYNRKLGEWYGKEVGIFNRAYGGQSGSGAYAEEKNGNRIVYAVLSNGNDFLTKFPRITLTKFEDIRDDNIANKTPSTFDLIPLNVTVSPLSIFAGEQLTSMSYLVHNYSSASWSGNVDVNVYLSTDDNISTKDTLIQSHTFNNNFSPKSSVRVDIPTPPTIPKGTSDGDYFIGVILDISDYREKNNDSDGQDASPLSVDDVDDDVDDDDVDREFEYGLGDIPLSPEEYQQYLKISVIDKGALLTLPTAYDARDYGLVTVAKHQGGCGSCWAFAIVGAFESHLLKETSVGITDLSEQEQVSCNTDMGGCCGGNMIALQYWGTDGPIYETCSSYGDSGTDCDFTNSAIPCSYAAGCTKLPYIVTNFHTIYMSDPEQVKTSVYNDGPSYFQFIVYEDFFDYWSGTKTWPDNVYVNQSETEVGGHAVLIIGWDNTLNAYRCKNSWGSTGGPFGDGTFLMAISGHASYIGFGMCNFNLKYKKPPLPPCQADFDYDGDVDFDDYAIWMSEFPSASCTSTNPCQADADEDGDVDNDDFDIFKSEFPRDDCPK